ncbi:MAG: hypothetical protein H7A37_04425 [Chlamydiales bacterium]|nr:hypothetical protein [Chlamydiia bacterium]MCP5507529.1 hypothetical protein [Chlamydiales bacterium]
MKKIVTLLFVALFSLCNAEECCGYYAYGSLVYLHTQMDDLEYAVHRTNNVIFSPLSVETNGVDRDLDFTWKPGVQAGIGIDTGCGWYLELSGIHYTYYVGGETTLESNELNVEQLNPTWFPGLMGFSCLSADAEWKLDYHVVDFEVGKTLCCSGCVSFTPSVGIRYLNVGQRYRVAYTDCAYLINDGGSDVTFFKDNNLYLESNYNGVGIKIASNFNYQMCSSLEFDATVSTSAVYGGQDTDSYVNGAFPSTFTGSLILFPVIYTKNDSPNRLFYNLDLEVGSTWNACEWCGYELSLTASYLFTIWFHMNPFINNSFSDDPTGLVGAVNTNSSLVTSKLHGNLQMHGFTVGANVKF